MAAEARSQKLLDADYNDMNRKVMRERKEREMFHEMLKDQCDYYRLTNYR